MARSIGALLAIDLGTSKVKAGLVSSEGALLGIGRRSYPLHHPGPEGWVEQEAEEWWSATAQAVREALAQSGVAPREVAATCIGGQGPSLVLVDRDARPVAPALIWMDTRAEPLRRELSARWGREASSYSFIHRLLWLARHRPELVARTRFALQPWDFIGHRLTGGRAAAISSYPGDVDLSAARLVGAELDPALLPPPVEMGRTYGETAGPWAEACGLPPGLPVIGGVNDNMAGIIGAGVTVPGRAAETGGTSGGALICLDRPLSAPGLDTPPGLAPGTWLAGGAFSAGGASLEWWARVLAAGQPPALPQVLTLAERAPPGADGLLFLPSLAGERTPGWNPDARGAFFGLTSRHEAAHLSRAVLEGAAYQLRHLLEHLAAAGAQLRELRLCGGPAQSLLWSQIKADVLGRPVALPQVTDVALMGLACLASVGLGRHPELLTASEAMVRIARWLEPRGATRSTYDALFPLYRRLHAAVEPLSGPLARAVAAGGTDPSQA